VTNTILFVDYENVNKVDLSAIPADVRVPFFFGASQKSVPTEFLKAALKLGDRFHPIDIEGQGANALDFHIAFYLGEALAEDSAADCIILSKDKGFDPLVKHLKGRGLTVRRASTLGDAFAVRAEPPKQYALAAVCKWLEGMPVKARPAKRKGLVAHVHSHFAKKISEGECTRLVDQLIAEKIVVEVEGKLTYKL
jgi:hypothetical protein